MITYLTGDVTKPQGDGPKLVAHIVNDAGGFGKGVSGQISKRWLEVERVYRTSWSRRMQSGSAFRLGLVQIVPCTDQISVANMVAQRGYSKPGKPACDLGALKTCLRTVCFYLKSHGTTTLHIPRLGCGLGGLAWSDVEPVIAQALSADMEIFVYDLE